MSRRNRPEQALQIAVAQFLTVAMPENVFWFHCPNGGKRNKAEAGILKAMGVKAGVGDLIFLRRDPFVIELKSKDGRLTASQVETKDALLKAGVRCFEARSVEEVEFLLRHIGIALKATTGSHLEAAAREVA